MGFLGQLVLAGGCNQAQHIAHAPLGIVAGLAVTQVQGRPASRSVVHQYTCPRVFADGDGAKKVNAARRRTRQARGRRCSDSASRSMMARTPGLSVLDSSLAAKLTRSTKRAAVNPLDALVPAFHRGRLQQALAHVEHIVGHLFDAQRRGLVASRHADGSLPPVPPAP